MRATYFIAPTVLAAAWLAPVTTSPAGAASAPASITPCKQGLSNASDPHFRVWACNDDEQAGKQERATLADFESVYRKMTALMGKPLPDCKAGSDLCKERGGDGRIDIYLLHPKQAVRREGIGLGLEDGELGLTIPSAEKGVHSSGYILLPRALLQSDPSYFKSVVIHEFFHVLSNRYNDSAHCLLPGNNLYWFVEASATWAETYFARSTAPKFVYNKFFTNYFQPNPGASLTDPVKRTPYADFVWPFFMEQETGGPQVIATAWKALADADTCAEMTNAMNDTFSFAKHFGDFAVEDFDFQPIDLDDSMRHWPVDFGNMYQQVDKGFPKKLPLTDTKVLSDKKTDHETIKVNLPPLSAQYDDVEAGLAFQHTGLPVYGMEIDLSGIKNRGRLDAYAMAAEAGTGRPYKRIDIVGNRLAICAARDNGMGLSIDLILANHASGAGQNISGSVKVTSDLECAKSVSGTISYTYSCNVTSAHDCDPNDGGVFALQYSDKVTLNNLHYVQAPTTWTIDTSQGSYNWDASSSCTPSDPSCDYTVSATDHSYVLPGGGFYGPALNAFDQSFAGTQAGFAGDPGLPGLGPPGLAPATASNGMSEVNIDGISCPFGPTSANPFDWLMGTWKDNFTVLDFTCSDSGNLPSGTQQITVTGHLHATDPIPCGIWTKNCSVTGANAQPKRS